MISEDQICSILNTQLSTYFGRIRAMTLPITEKKQELQNLINSLPDEEDFYDRYIISDKMDEFLRNISSNDAVTAVSRILNCFGLHLGVSIPNLNLPKIGIMDTLKEALNDFIGDLLSSIEQQILDLINRIEELIPTDLIDRMLMLASCLAGCSQGAYVDPLGIEDELNKNLTSITGEVDLDQFDNVTDNVKSRIKFLKDKKKSVENTVQERIKSTLS